MTWLTEKWRSLTAGSWRGLSETTFWNDHDAVIATTEQGRGGRGNSYEVWTFGALIATRPSLSEAEAVVEDVYGPQQWETVKLDSIEVIHRYFGPTTEFTDPTTLHVVRKLPRL